jgi:PKD repeat protein
LTVTNDRGLSSSTTQVLSVGAGAVPVPVFTFSPSAPGVNEPVFFNATTSTAGSGHTISSYRWTFGDGTTASGATVSHAYAAAGTFTVQLTVTDEVGQSATSAGTTITIGNPPGPTARFTFSPTSPAIGDSVVFVAATSSTAQGSTITDYFWNFGDGTPVSQTSSPIISHQYANTGTFTVNLQIRDNAGRTSTASSTVSVGSGAPVPTFTVSPSSPQVGQTVTFDAAATQTSGGATIQSYSWNFGDTGTSTNGPVTTHVFTTAASRTVTLTVVDSLNRRATTSQSITITP